MIAWLYNRIYLRHIVTRPCQGCEDSSFHDAHIHDAHMTKFGWWRLTRSRQTTT